MDMSVDVSHYLEVKLTLSALCIAVVIGLHIFVILTIKIDFTHYKLYWSFILSVSIK